jgi:hypothetical protein
VLRWLRNMRPEENSQTLASESSGGRWHCVERGSLGERFTDRMVSDVPAMHERHHIVARPNPRTRRSHILARRALQRLTDS